MRRWYVLGVGAAAIVGVGAGALLHDRLQSGASALPMLPALNGEATWKAGARPAPLFALRDQHGRTVSLTALRGRTVALTFMDSICRSACPIEGRMLAAAIRTLPVATRPKLVVVSVDPRGDTPATAAKAVRKWKLPAGTSWLMGSRAQLAPVWSAYQITVEPVSGDVIHSVAVYLLDKRGDERAGFLVPFIPGLVTGDLRKLAAERPA